MGVKFGSFTNIYIGICHFGDFYHMPPTHKERRTKKYIYYMYHPQLHVQNEHRQSQCRFMVWWGGGGGGGIPYSLHSCSVPTPVLHYQELKVCEYP